MFNGVKLIVSVTQQDEILLGGTKLVPTHERLSARSAQVIKPLGGSRAGGFEVAYI